jgi:hypothetical protein
MLSVILNLYSQDWTVEHCAKDDHAGKVLKGSSKAQQKGLRPTRLCTGVDLLQTHALSAAKTHVLEELGDFARIVGNTLHHDLLIVGAECVHNLPQGDGCTRCHGKGCLRGCFSVG